MPSMKSLLALPSKLVFKTLPFFLWFDIAMNPSLAIVIVDELKIATG